MNLLDALARFFAPDSCLACGREGTILCAACASLLSPVVGRCFSCHASTPNVVACGACLLKTGCRQISAACSYTGVAKELVAQLKFYGNQSAADTVARIMARYLPADPDLITYMPATTGHIRERGYDQAALIARRLSKLSGSRPGQALARTGQKHQLGSGRQQRLEQLAGALRVIRPAAVAGQRIVLIDDVLTTGASVVAATALLLVAGARSVDVLVFAQAPPTKKASNDGWLF